MYAAFYGLAEKPFGLTPDPKYLFLSSRHNEAIAHLEFGRRERGGFILITGEVGTGKTTLARHFLGHLDEQTLSAVVLYPALSSPELLRSILSELRIPHDKDTSLKELVDALHAFLLEVRRRDQNVVLLIDEAQDLQPEVLEQVRLISNLETDTEKLLQIVLIGQSELLEMLERRDLRQLAQRLTARYHLTALDREECEHYIRHRLMVAGGAGKVSFTRAALDAVYRRTRGIPRVINLVCDRALLAGYIQGTRMITPSIVTLAANEALGARARRRRRIPVAATVLGAGILAAFTLVAWPHRASFRSLNPFKAAPLETISAASASGGEEATAWPESRPARLAPLAPQLVGLSREASFRQSVQNVSAAWGHDDLLMTAMRTHIEQVRRLDIPVIMELFLPTRYDTCFIALIRLDSPDTAAVVVGNGAPQRVSVRELERFWTRQAVFLWRDVAGLSRDWNRERIDRWTRSTLIEMGYRNENLSAAVREFQLDADLVPDGTVGRRTLMALYSLAKHPHPRLSGDAS